MYNIEENKPQNGERLLQVLMAFLNISVLAATAFVGWSIYTLIVRSEEIYNVVTGSVLP